MMGKAGGYISKVHFNDGSVLDVESDSIVIFVGPNNAGKSQALKDLYHLTEKRVSTIVVSDIEIKKNETAIKDLLDSIAIGQDNGSYISYGVLGKKYTYTRYNEDEFYKGKYYSGYRNLFVANLNTSNRLNICNPVGNISRNASKSHPIHYVEFDQKYRKWLSENFKKAFGVGIIPNPYFGVTVPLCIGEPIKFDSSFEDEQERLEAYANILESYKQVQDQGDGVKSFTGILLYLMLDYYRTFLIDEPEAFLHPPQAKMMGHIIGQKLDTNQQAFISTHSGELIQGLLEVCPNRLKIVRITREEDKNHFAVLDNEMIRTVWQDPILRYSNILSSLFHKVVVLCESDSDCKMYSIIERNIKESKGFYSEALFIHCGGKQRMAKIVSALRALDIDIKLIVDFDVMSNKNDIKNIVEAFGMNWNEFERDYRIIDSNIRGSKKELKREKIKKEINDLLNESADEYINDYEIKNLKELLKQPSDWKRLKEVGIVGVPAGDAQQSFGNLNKRLSEAGIFIVPVGELECFIKNVGGHGSEWVNRVLEQYPDKDDSVYDKIKEFIEDVNI